MDVIGPGTLKLVVGAPPTSAAAIEAALRKLVRPEDVRRLGDAFVVYTDREPAALRDALARALGDGASLLVVEFERWSSYGPAVDRPWLLRRGH